MFECSTSRDCEIRAHGLCAGVVGGDLPSCVEHIMGEIKRKRPHLRVAPPSEDMFQ